MMGSDALVWGVSVCACAVLCEEVHLQAEGRQGRVSLDAPGWLWLSAWPERKWMWCAGANFESSWRELASGPLNGHLYNIYGACASCGRGWSGVEAREEYQQQPLCMCAFGRCWGRDQIFGKGVLRGCPPTQGMGYGE
jgi:hypothetical protein